MEIQWPLVFFTLLTCLGAGTFIVVAVSEWLGKMERTRMPGALTALGALFAGGVASVLHLGHPERIFNALGHWGSGIMLEMILMGLALLAVVVYILMLRSGYNAQARKAVATFGLVDSVIVSFSVGYSYVLAARPVWNTLLLPMAYLASAFVLGCFTMYVWTVVCKEDDDTIKMMIRSTLIVFGVQVFIMMLYLVYIAAAPYPDETRSITRFLAGDLAPVFWIGLIIIGLLVPSYLTIRSLTLQKLSLSPQMVSIVSLVCVVVGGLSFRILMYLLGTSIDSFL